MAGLAERLGFGRPSPIGFTLPPSPSVDRHCAELWRRLPRRNGAPRQEVVPPREIGDTGGVECPAHTAVTVSTGAGADGQIVRIHANVISFDSGRQAVAGQSPQAFAFTEKFLVQGLDTGNGLFQFVDPKNHRIDPLTQELVRPLSERTLLGQILNRWQKAVDEQEPLVLAGRYEVSGITENQSDDLYARYSMTAVDRQNGNRTVTVPLTQVALPFENNRLCADQIEHANTLLESHRNSYQPLMESAAARGRHDPAILSKKGIGRNAALITYREVLAKIAEEGASFNLLNALEEVVTKERLDRGKDFLHSEDQLEEVHAALSKYLGERQQANQARFSWLSPRRRRIMPVTQGVEPGIAGPAVGSPVTPAAASPIALPRVNYRARTLDLLNAHAADTPLQLFDALVNEDPEVAAFCAIQARRALTAIEDTNSAGYQFESMHDNVNVDIVDSDTPGVFSDHSICFENVRKTDGLAQTTTLQDMLAEDVKQAMVAADAQVISQTNSGAFPQGLEVALQTGRRQRVCVDPVPTPKLSAENIDLFFAENADAQPLQLMEMLAKNNPSLATLIHFLEHGLLVRDSQKPLQCERFDYVVDLAAEEQLYTKSRERNGQKHFPTFIAGVNRSLSSRHDKWQIQVDGECLTTSNTATVYRHILAQAFEHLHATAAPANASVLYPLAAYKLLAKSIGLDQIPAYLHEHEAALIETTCKNKADKEQAAIVSRQVRLERDAQRKEEQRIIEANQQRHYAELGVENWQQEDLLGTNNYRDDLLNQSIDIERVLPIQSDTQQLLENFKQDLLQSHEHQVISSRVPGDPSREDHLSWLRTSWLSLFDALTPQQLADRLRAMEKEPQLIENDARLLQAIAETYRKHPAAFLQGEIADEIYLSSGAPAREKLFNFQAVLGPSVSLDQALYDHPEKDQLRIPLAFNIEQFLTELQLKAVMAYRSNYNGIEGPLSALLMRPGPADSTLPVALHRAFGVPLLLVQKNADDAAVGIGLQDSMESRLRMTAPSGSAMATKFEQVLESKDQLNEGAMAVLLIGLSETAVIWREGKHYSIFLPKTFIPDGVNLFEEKAEEVPVTRSPPVSLKDKALSWLRRDSNR